MKAVKTINLKIWLPLLTVMLYVFLAGLQIAFSYQSKLKEIDKTGRESVKSILFETTQFINYALANGAESDVLRIVTTTALLDNVTEVVFMDSALNIIYSSRLAWSGRNADKVLPDKKLAFINASHGIESEHIARQNGSFYAITTLNHGGVNDSNHQKAIFLEYDLSMSLENADNEAFREVIPALLFTLVSLIVLLQFVRRYVSRPLLRLNELAGKIQSREADINNPLLGKNELAEVGQALADAGMKFRQDYRHLQDRENRLSITLNAIGDGVIVTDDQGIIRRINPTAEEMTGWKASEALMQQAGNVFRTRSLTSPEIVDPVAEVLASGQSVKLHNHTVLLARDDKVLQIFQSASPIFEDDKIVGVVLVFRDVSKEYSLRTKLKQSVDFLENLLQISPSITFVIKNDPNTNDYAFTYVSESISRYTGFSSHEWIKNNRHWQSQIHPNDLDTLRASFKQAVTKSGDVTSAEFRILNKDGQYQTFQVNFVAITEDHMLSQVVGVAVDISEQIETEQLNLFLGNILERSLNEIYIFDSQTLQFILVNYGARHNLGYSMEELKLLTPLDLKKDMSMSEFESLIQPLKTGESNKVEFETVHYRKDGTHYPVSVSLQLESQNDQHVFVAIISDITKAKQSESRINFLAFHDVLTELPNRSLFDERLNQAISRNQRRQSQFALLYMDLDRFKTVNDTLGHASGDELLIHVSERLKSQLREGDTVSRTGGDEFSLLLIDSDANAAAHVAEKILKVIAEPFIINKQTLYVTTSIGISIFPDNGDNAAILKLRADNAMYRAKATRPNSYQFYTEEMHERMQHRVYLESQMHLAIEKNELSMVYQPQLDLQTNRVIGAEALLRWQHRKFGPISPAEFIPIAEESGLIGEIGDWVLQEVISQVAKWKKAAPSETDFVTAVNISGYQFRNTNLADDITTLLDAYQLTTRDIEIEITESTAMDDVEHTLTQMQRLASAGIQLSMDDFGTGYSSLTSLKKFPIKKLKIDKSFIDDMLIDEDDLAIVDAIITLAQTLKLVTVAEGVESESQLDELKARGCLAIQGYVYSKPLPADEFISLVTKTNT